MAKHYIYAIQLPPEEPYKNRSGRFGPQRNKAHLYQSPPRKLHYLNYSLDLSTVLIMIFALCILRRLSIPAGIDRIVHILTGLFVQIICLS